MSSIKIFGPARASLTRFSQRRLSPTLCDCLVLHRRRCSSAAAALFSESYREAFTGIATSPLSRSLSTSKNKPRYDPMAKRPTQLCDPYGQGGKPLSGPEADGLMATVHADWNLEFHDDDDDNAGDDKTARIPRTLIREFVHTDYAAGARWIRKMAAVAQLQNHFPTRLTLERRIVRKNWHVVTRVTCSTTVLGGLSTHDFHLAMMIDVEVDRPEVQALLAKEEEEDSG